MPPLVRKPTIEETVFSGIARGLVYFTYVIRQLIIFLPCLWAGYERERRKEERIRKMREQGGGSIPPRRKYAEFLIIEANGIKWTKNDYDFWGELGIKEDDMEDILEKVLQLYERNKRDGTRECHRCPKL